MPVTVTTEESVEPHARVTPVTAWWSGPVTVTSSEASSATARVSGQAAPLASCTAIAPVGASSSVQVVRSAPASRVVAAFRYRERLDMNERVSVFRRRT